MALGENKAIIRRYTEPCNKKDLAVLSIDWVQKLYPKPKPKHTHTSTFDLFQVGFSYSSCT